MTNDEWVDELSDEDRKRIAEALDKAIKRNKLYTWLVPLVCIGGTFALIALIHFVLAPLLGKLIKLL